MDECICGMGMRIYEGMDDSYDADIRSGDGEEIKYVEIKGAWGDEGNKRATVIVNRGLQLVEGSS